MRKLQLSENRLKENAHLAICMSLYIENIYTDIQEDKKTIVWTSLYSYIKSSKNYNLVQTA